MCAVAPSDERTYELRCNNRDMINARNRLDGIGAFFWPEATRIQYRTVPRYPLLHAGACVRARRREMHVRERNGEYRGTVRY
jgi:hypothetical protein